MINSIFFLLLLHKIIMCCTTSITSDLNIQDLLSNPIIKTKITQIKILIVSHCSQRIEVRHSNFQRKSVFRICWMYQWDWDQGCKEPITLGGSKGVADHGARFAMSLFFLLCHYYFCQNLLNFLRVLLGLY